jgi:hypothetical protein
VVVYAKLILQDRLVNTTVGLVGFRTFGGCVAAVRRLNIQVEISSLEIWVEQMFA